MRILYGVSGEGFGHSSRALVVADYLEKKGHEVIILTYGQAYKVLRKMFRIFKVYGLKLIFNKSILNKKKTINYNLKHFSKNSRKLKKFHRLMKDFNPDLCISDMEPIVPILSFWYKKPLVSLDNQHRLTHMELNIPQKYKKDYILAKEVVKIFVRSAKYFIITSFIEDKSNGNSFVVAPIIRDSVKKIKPVYGKNILVYLTKKDRRVLSVLKEVNENFIVYGYNKKMKKGNLEFKQRESFLEDLKKCKAIVATSGFTLISEALYLKKPYFALPLGGQFEQVLNSLFLKSAGFGDYSECLSKRELINFLNNLDKYKNKLERYNPDYNKLFKVLDKIIKKECLVKK